MSTFYAYHWTTKERAAVIMQEGLRKGSYVCREPELWSGEVCIVVEFDKPLPFDQEGMWSWQLRMGDRAMPFRLRVLEG